MITWKLDAGALVACIVPVMTVWREASGEGDAGMLAVAMVIRNRMLQRKQTAEEVCMQAWQFSSMNAPKDPGMIHWPGASDPSFLEAFNQWLASASVTPEQDPTKGAQFYYAEGIAIPAWASAFTKTVQIGRQIFYRQA